MIGKDLHELSEKGVRMRCSDYYGNHPERDGPILVGILIGKHFFFFKHLKKCYVLGYN